MMSENIKNYFNSIEGGVKKAYDIANLARAKGFDPDENVSILLAKDMAERVEGLVSVVAPQLKGCGIVPFIKELEKEYAPQDWRVAFRLAEEVAKERFCTFKDKREAIEVGLRIGLAYITNGVVSSPLEGFVKLDLKKRKDNGNEYFALFFSGPIRSAGTTAACIFVVLCDYIRRKLGYDEYDPTDIEIKRSITEIHYFHERITNLQYLPSEEEIEFLVKHLPVQITGDPSEEIEVPNYKDLDRVETNKLRNGFCLVMAEGLSQKLKKFWGKFSKYYKDFNMDNWGFIEDFLKLQKDIRAKGEVKKEKGVLISADYNYIKDIVGGRPVLGHPLRTGAFRLRFGRGRNSGFAAEAIHPATMCVLNNYIAIGTQLKMERPNKSTVISSCDSIEGPIVKLKDDSIVFLENEEEAKKYVGMIKEVLFLGDILIDYGDFFVFNHILVPPGYCEEWWALELEKAAPSNKEFEKYFKDPFYEKPGFDEAYKISKKYNIPLHPRYTFHWKDLKSEQILSLAYWLSHSVIKENKIIMPLEYNFNKELIGVDSKRALECLGVPHLVATNEYAVIEGDWAKAFMCNFNCYSKTFNLDNILKNIGEEKDGLAIINNISEAKLKDKSGLFVGARMGRPEKAKMRKLTGSPQVLFPVGSEGGRLRSMQETLKLGKVKAQFSVFYCDTCKKETIYPLCEDCNNKTTSMYVCKLCGKSGKDCEHKPVRYETKEVDMNHYFKKALEKLNLREYTTLIKGIRGTSNKDHIPENIVKGILRSKNEIYVNKDGTVRYDMTEMPLTHFKPVEIGTSVERLKELGYIKDIYGNDLVNDNQVLELRLQDVILPSCPDSLEEGADAILFRVANFIDELLVNLYGLDKFYNLKKKEDIVGHFVVGLSPHTAAGIVARVIGFSKIQALLAHPLFHSIMRRDCVHPSTKLFFYDEYDKSVFYDNLGKYIDELIKNGAKTKKIDGVGTLSVENKKNLYALGIDPKTHELKKKRIKYFIKGPKTKKWIKVITATNREYIMTQTHKFMHVDELGNFKFKNAEDIKIDDRLPVLENFNFYFDKNEIDLIDLFNKKLSLEEKKKIIVIDDGEEIKFLDFKGKGSKDVKLRVVFSKYKINSVLKIDKNLMRILGYYTSEGHSRINSTVAQVSFRICNEDMQNHLINLIKNYFKINVNLGEDKTKITICHKIIHYFFKSIGAGKGAYEKRVPSFILSLGNNLVKEYISAYFEGDGSVNKIKRNIVFYSVSRDLLDDIALLLAKFNVLGRYFRTGLRLPGRKVLERYKELGKEPKQHILNHLVLGTYDSYKLSNILSLANKNKLKDLSYLRPASRRMLNYNGKQILLEAQSDYVIDYVKNVEIIEDEKNSYCVEIEWKEKEDRNVLWGEQVINTRCDGDEAGVMLLMDAFLNFSRKLLSDHRGATQDEPLVLSSLIVPSEVDDQVFYMGTTPKYPLEFYEACLEYKAAPDVKIEIYKDRLKTEKQFEGLMFTHPTKNFNNGVICSAYKTIPTMQDKVLGQMEIAERLRAVDESDVARLVIERHFMRDIKGNLRKFSTQQFRCSSCNEKFRRPPLIGICTKCGGKLLFTVTEGSVTKYLEPSINLAEKYNLPVYLKQSLELVKQSIESVFGKEKEKQEGLGKWF